MARPRVWIAAVAAAALGAAGPVLATSIDPASEAAAAGDSTTTTGDTTPTTTTPVTTQPAPTQPRYPKSTRTTFLLSRAFDGGLPNGPSRNPSVSGDGRIARGIAFESDASNLVAGDTNGLTDIFVTFRRKPWGEQGTPWQIKGTALISNGLGGAPANGRSYRPATDGDRTHKLSCIAFVSDASNLVPGDTNGKPDAFIYDLRRQTMERVSTDTFGLQSNGSTYDVAVDGTCDRIAFTSDATNLALRRAPGHSTKGAETNRPIPGTRQVYVKFRRAFGGFTDVQGVTFLASANNRGRAANSNSFDPDITRDGRALVFTSEATNLAAGDPTNHADVYRRQLKRYQPSPKNGVKQPLTLRLRTRLVSMNSSARGANGPSTQPVISSDGRYVAFTTFGSDLNFEDNNGVSDVVRADMKYDPPHFRVASRSDYGIGNGPSQNPAISAIGWVIVYDTLASNIRPRGHKTDKNGARDLGQWYVKSRRSSIESRASDNGFLKSASQHPSMGLHGNYVGFESAEPMIDRDFAAAQGYNASFDRSVIPPLIDPGLITPPPPTPGTAPQLQQIYVRYEGACARTEQESESVHRCFLN